MTDRSPDDIIKAQQDEIAALRARLDAAATAPLAAGGAEFPRCVYRRGGKPGQVDHPGNEVATVDGAEALAALLAEGWSLTPLAPEATTEAEAAPATSPEPPKADAGKKGRK